MDALKSMRLIQKHENKINRYMTGFLDAAEDKKWRRMNKSFVLLLRSAGSISRASKQTEILFHDLKMRGIRLMQDLNNDKITIEEYTRRLHEHFLKAKVFLMHTLETKKREIAREALTAKHAAQKKAA